MILKSTQTLNLYGNNFIRSIMSKKPNHQANIKNPNKGTSGTNTTYDKNQGNRGKQLNPEIKKGK